MSLLACLYMYCVAVARRRTARRRRSPRRAGITWPRRHVASRRTKPISARPEKNPLKLIFSARYFIYWNLFILKGRRTGGGVWKK